MKLEVSWWRNVAFPSSCDQPCSATYVATSARGEAVGINNYTSFLGPRLHNAREVHGVGMRTSHELYMSCFARRGATAPGIAFSPSYIAPGIAVVVTSQGSSSDSISLVGSRIFTYLDCIPLHGTFECVDSVRRSLGFHDPDIVDCGARGVPTVEEDPGGAASSHEGEGAFLLPLSTERLLGRTFHCDLLVHDCVLLGRLNLNIACSGVLLDLLVVEPSVDSFELDRVGLALDGGEVLIETTYVAFIALFLDVVCPRVSTQLFGHLCPNSRILAFSNNVCMSVEKLVRAQRCPIVESLTEATILDQIVFHRLWRAWCDSWSCRHVVSNLARVESSGSRFVTFPSSTKSFTGCLTAPVETIFATRL